MGQDKDKDKGSQSVDSAGNPYNFIVVIDAGSNGSRAYLYRAKMFGPQINDADGDKLADDSNNLDDLRSGEKINDSDDDSEEFEDSDDEDEDHDDRMIARDWKETKEGSAAESLSYPEIELIKHKKVKPGIASFLSDPKKLGKKNIGKILNSVIKHIPKDQISRTPVFLHATGGMRLLRHEDQSTVLNRVCSYIQDNYDLFLPDCDSHINTITGEVEGLYSWIGVNYKYGLLNHQAKEKSSSLGMLDMGGVSSQIAFEPLNSNAKEVLFSLDLDYSNKADDSLTYDVFSQSLLSGMHQAHSKYDQQLAANGSNVDPCLPVEYVKKIKNEDNDKVDIQGGGNFEKCLNSLYDVLLDVNKDKYCNQTDATSASSCLLSDELPKMDFNVDKFIGVNEFYSNLKKFVNYKEFYENTKKICETSYSELITQNDNKKNPEKLTEMCFKSSWIIDVLHQGVNFPRYGIDDIDETSNPTSDEILGILDDYSWTLGRAVLYNYYEAAAQQLSDKDSSARPHIGYYEPSSKLFVYGGEVDGVDSRPLYVKNSGNSLKHDNGYGSKADDDNDDVDSDNDDDDDNDWDDVLEGHRLWGSLLMLLTLLIIAYLMLGKTRRRTLKDTVKKMWRDRFGSSTRYGRVADNELELELGEFELNDDELENDDRNINLSENHNNKKKNNDRDSFELSE